LQTDAGEVVSVLVGAITGGLVGGEDVLDLLECLRVDECLVAAWVLDAVAGHDPGVVVVSQDAIGARLALSLDGVAVRLRPVSWLGLDTHR
jgi:hypothetical protein